MSPSPEYSHLKIVLIESHPEIRVLLRSQLFMFSDADILEAGDSTEGLAIIRKTQPKIVVTSLNLDPYDGIELTRVLRQSADSPHPYVPIVLLLPESAQNRISEARDAGVNAILLSPVSVQNLQTHINEILMHPRPFIRTRTYFGPDRRLRPRQTVQAETRRAAQFNC